MVDEREHKSFKKIRRKAPFLLELSRMRTSLIGRIISIFNVYSQKIRALADCHGSGALFPV